MDIRFHKKLIAETFGTFCVVFAGTSSIVVSGEGEVARLSVAITFGLIVFAMVAALGDVSGAHLNPAVTVGFSLARRFPIHKAAPYIFSQCAGAILASLCVRFLFPAHETLGATMPIGPVYRSWVLEVILAAILMFVVLSVSTGAREKGITAGLAIGGTIASAALFAGPMSGASMNPARSLGPALVSGELEALWVYLTAPIVGVALAVLVCACVRQDRCCLAVSEEVSK